MSLNYTYRVFISYSHYDNEKAIYIENLLKNYILPKSLQNWYIDMPKDLNPIFRDASGLTSGNVNNALDEKLKKSKNLVIISTENSQNSEWVDYEIKVFKKFNPDCSIIPVIFSSQTIIHKELENENLVEIPLYEGVEKESLYRLVASCLGKSIEPYQVKQDSWIKRNIGIFKKIAYVGCMFIMLFIGLNFRINKNVISANKQKKEASYENRINKIKSYSTIITTDYDEEHRNPMSDSEKLKDNLRTIEGELNEKD